MGTWQLEVAKMGLYITFPVALFYYFNQPKYFEDWVVRTKQEMYPPETDKTREFRKSLKEIQTRQELKLAASKEEKH